MPIRSYLMVLFSSMSLITSCLLVLSVDESDVDVPEDQPTGFSQVLQLILMCSKV